MKNSTWIFIFLIMSACLILVLISNENELRMRMEHEFVMKKLELEPRYHVDSLQEIKWRNQYYQLIKQYHDAEK